MENTNTRPGPKEVFLQLLSMVTFYISAVSFMVLMFQAINLTYVDPQAFGTFYFQRAFQGIRWGAAFLIIVFPIFFFLTRYLRRLYQTNQTIRDMKIRKWLTYFTLFVAAVTFIITLVTLLFHFLDNELTVRFILKVITVLFVAIAGFWYYQQELENPEKFKMKYLLYVIIFVVAVAVGIGLYLSTSPEARQLQKANYIEAIRPIPVREYED